VTKQQTNSEANKEEGEPNRNEIE